MREYSVYRKNESSHPSQVDHDVININKRRFFSTLYFFGFAQLWFSRSRFSVSFRFIFIVFVSLSNRRNEFSAKLMRILQFERTKTIVSTHYQLELFWVIIASPWFSSASNTYLNSYFVRKNDSTTLVKTIAIKCLLANSVIFGTQPKLSIEMHNRHSRSHSQAQVDMVCGNFVTHLINRNLLNAQPNQFCDVLFPFCHSSFKSQPKFRLVESR